MYFILELPRTRKGKDSIFVIVEWLTLEVLKEHFLMPHMRKHVERHCGNCIACQKAKYKAQSHGLCTPLPIPSLPWVDISMNFIL